MPASHANAILPAHLDIACSVPHPNFLGQQPHFSIERQIHIINVGCHASRRFFERVTVAQLARLASWRVHRRAWQHRVTGVYMERAMDKSPSVATLTVTSA